MSQLPISLPRLRSAPDSARLAWVVLLVLVIPLILAACQPIQAPAVAPDVDRVGFPEDYQNEFSVFYEFDRPSNQTARVIYANEAAASVEPNGAYPYGSILVMDVYSTQKDEAGNALLDEDGRYVRDELFGAFIMRKEPGYGAKYGDFRNGEWEYVAYRPDGSVLVPPEDTTGCAKCHMEAGMGKDWVFGTHRAFGEEMPSAPVDVPENGVNVDNYQFDPAVITVTAGSEVTWVNNDDFLHTVTANDTSFGSGALRVQDTYAQTFEEPGEYDYFCAIHPSMRGKVVVVEP